MNVFERLSAFLASREIPHEVLRHAPVFTSEEAARVRGTTLSSGAKALVCKCDERQVMFVLPANLRLASKRLRQTLPAKSIRFATAEEVLELTSLRPGSIPPFGSLFGLPTYCDLRLLSEPRINFNAGDHAISISMTSGDYQRAEQPICLDLADVP